MTRCQLCPLHDRYGTDRHDAEGTVAVDTDDEGVKVLDCCKACVELTFDYNPEFQLYAETARQRGDGNGGGQA